MRSFCKIGFLTVAQDAASGDDPDEIVLVADGKVKAKGDPETMLGGILSVGDAHPSCVKQEEAFR